MLGDVVLPAGEVVPQQHVEHLGRLLDVPGFTWMSRRVLGFMVVRFIMSGSFSPRPLLRWMVYFCPASSPKNWSFSRSL